MITRIFADRKIQVITNSPSVSPIVMSLEFARNRHLILYGPYPALAQQPEQQQMIDSQSCPPRRGGWYPSACSVLEPWNSLTAWTEFWLVLASLNPKRKSTRFSKYEFSSSITNLGSGTSTWGCWCWARLQFFSFTSWSVTCCSES